MNFLIPMAGRGSRFSEMSDLPKPLIDFCGVPMIHNVIKNLVGTHIGKIIFVVLSEHIDDYSIDEKLLSFAPGCKIVQCDSVTEGPASTTLLAEYYINNNKPLVIANCDQIIGISLNRVFDNFYRSECDGGIITFPSTDSKWSYAKVGDDNYVSEVAEKNPISEHATAGIYYWRRGSDYVKYVKKMIEKNVRVNNEFYVCPVYNEAIQDSKKIVIHEISSNEMYGLGDPEEFQDSLQRLKNAWI
jgi:dTDP-glucose pyrophosphorylase